MNTINKAELIRRVAGAADVTVSSTTHIINALIDEAGVAVKNGDTIDIRGLVKIEPVTRAARTGRNPLTGESIEIPAKVALKAKASKMLIGGAA